MNEDRGLGAMPKLYGAPAYARPPAIPVAPVDRPIDPDDMPLESERSPEDPESMGHPQPRSYEAVATAEPLPRGERRLDQAAWAAVPPAHPGQELQRGVGFTRQVAPWGSSSIG